jgi:hypothetical protein
VYAAYEFLIVSPTRSDDDDDDDDAKKKKKKKKKKKMKMKKKKMKTRVASAAWWRLFPSVAAAFAYLRARDALCGASSLVKIYRKVENPIAFASDATERRLSLFHLHARYAWLLAWPRRLRRVRVHAARRATAFAP